MNIAIVLAGGTGSRMGADIPKQFIPVAGKPVMIYTLETFQADPWIDEIVLVSHGDHMDRSQELCRRYGLTKVRRVIPGGADFTLSCANGMNSLRETCAPEDIVVITSADRPFISREEIHDAISVCERHGSGVAAQKCSLCMFLVGEDRTHSGNYQREALMQTATPWAFRFGPLMEAMDLYAAGRLPGCEAYPLAIYAAAGHEIYFSKGQARNFKITEKLDLMLMEKIIESAGDKSGK